MRINSKKRWALAAGLVALLAVGGLSKPGRSVVRGFVSRLRNEIAPTDTAIQTAATQQPQDVEQRARSAHGWSASVVNSVVRGAIIYYDPSGAATEQAALTIYRAYPDRVRVELYRRSGSQVFGFDSLAAWKSGVSVLTAEQTRDIRAYIRFAPERLFVTRDEGSGYREAGRRIEDSSDGTANQLIFDQAEVLDTIGPAPLPGRVGDRRRVYYYVKQTDSRVSTARWLEPDNPGQLIDDPNVAFTDVRVDFTRWTGVAGVLWPFEVTHWQGGRVDYRIVLNQVLVNQTLADALFEHP